jgi:hypothetical protein
VWQGLPVMMGCNRVVVVVVVVMIVVVVVVMIVRLVMRHIKEERIGFTQQVASPSMNSVIIYWVLDS